MAPKCLRPRASSGHLMDFSRVIPSFTRKVTVFRHFCTETLHYAERTNPQRGAKQKSTGFHRRTDCGHKCMSDICSPVLIAQSEGKYNKVGNNSANCGSFVNWSMRRHTPRICGSNVHSTPSRFTVIPSIHSQIAVFGFQSGRCPIRFRWSFRHCEGRPRRKMLSCPTRARISFWRCSMWRSLFKLLNNFGNSRKILRSACYVNQPSDWTDFKACPADNKVINRKTVDATF